MRGLLQSIVLYRRYYYLQVKAKFIHTLIFAFSKATNWEILNDTKVDLTMSSETALCICLSNGCCSPQINPLTYGMIIKRYRLPTYSSYPKDSWAALCKKLFIGRLIYPWKRRNEKQDWGNAVKEGSSLEVRVHFPALPLDCSLF